MGSGYKVVGHGKRRPTKQKGEEVSGGCGVTPKTFLGRGCGRIATSTS